MHRYRSLSFVTCCTCAWFWLSLVGSADEPVLSADTQGAMRSIPGDYDATPVPPQLQAADGVQLTLIAQHPQVVTPTGIDVDAQGRVFVVSSHTHFRPDDYVGPKHDEVIVLSADGRQRSVFYNKTTATMDLELGRDGWVYLAERDRILRVRDTDADGVGDEEQDVAVLQTEEDYPHNGLAGMAWAPSGDLIFALGENYWKQWTLRGTDGVEIKGTGEGGIFRCSPDGKRLERIAKGFWNPFGICVREDGTMFAAENDPGARPPCRLLHVVEGGDYGYQRLYGRAPYHPFVAWNGELAGTLPMVTATGEAPCGVVPLANGLLVPSWADHRIDFFPLTPQGASFSSNRVELVRGGDHFRPTCIVQQRTTRGSGKVTYYFCDWVFGSYELHGYGRVWKMEIDLRQTPGVDLDADTQPTAEAQLASALYGGTRRFSVEELFRLAAGSDPFVSRAALWALSRELRDVTVKNLPGKTPAERALAVLAIRLSQPKQDEIARVYLADTHAEVQFEALRWIADEQLAALKPDVDRVLQRPDLEYRIFAAAMATANTLDGNPRAGIEDPKILLQRLRDQQSPTRLRAFALRLIPGTHKALGMPLLRELLTLDDELMTREVVRVLATSSLATAPQVLLEVAQDAQQPLEVRLEAVAGLAGLPDSIPALVELAASNTPALRSEVLRSLRFAPLTTAQKQALAQLETPENRELLHVTLTPERLATKARIERSEAQWLADLESVAEPVDLQAGQRLFYHSAIGTCSKCHRHTGRGNVVGPDLSAINQGGTTALLRAVLQPSRDVSPQYYPWTLETEDGQRFTGIALRKGGRSGREYYRDASGQERSFLKSEIVARREVRTSMMPTGLVRTLTDRELRDLLAFLAQAKGK